MLEFDAKTAALLKEAYEGGDFARRRAANLQALDAKPGESVLDIGCGAGNLTLDLSRAVGPSGRAIGIDPSDDMLAAAAKHCEGRPNVTLTQGTANAMPLDDGSVDRAVSVQVFEYLDDVPAALTEARRVLRASGRVVIGDIHFDSLVWFSEKPERMRAMAEAWDHHLHERALPALLPRLMADAGYEIEQVLPVTISDPVGRPDGLARMLMRVMSAYAVQNALLHEEIVGAWTEEQERLIGEGRFFFSLTHFVVSGRKR